MTDEEAKQTRERIDRILYGARERFFRGQSKCDRTGDPVDYITPLDEVCAEEERLEHAAAVEALEATQMMLQLEQLPEPLAAMVRSFAFDSYRQCEEMWLDWLFQEGPSPLIVMKRLFAYVKMKRASLIWNMSFRDLGALFSETHAAFAMRCKVLFGDTPAGWKKPADARRNMQAAQMGNSNRRGGKRAARKKSHAKNNLRKHAHIP